MINKCFLIFNTTHINKKNISIIYYVDLHSLYRSHNIVRATKFRILRLARHVDKMEEGRRTFNILTSKPERYILKSN